ncbi:Lariat debranching enzyme [Nakaseomyces bracarensis]|uniref:Lariat debranching enzyme n=1 Tax=Nakaseomyces bracarensis TaxID=273131 RepID=A0ABR4NS95_9SACH
MAGKKLRVAVQGCCHGELNKVFAAVDRMHRQNPIDLLIILGDFQSLRSPEDLKSISIPQKYQKMGDFHQYYQNDSFRAPVFTIIIGGNHESMRHLMELPYGGYIANNMFYLGYSSVVWFKGLRIAGLSGIWKHWDFDKERPTIQELEVNNNWNKRVRELYHVRKADIMPLFMINKPIDICISHDWPSGAAQYGNVAELLRSKPFFERDINNGELGNPLTWELLRKLQPKYWFSAHLHVKYTALINHGKRGLISDAQNKRQKKNEDEIDLDLESDSDESNIKDSVPDDPRETFFMSLDKCMPRRQWLEVLEIETSNSEISDDNFYWDPEYIYALRKINENQKYLRKTNFNTIDWSKYHMVDAPHPNIYYRIQEYSPGIQRQESEQTSQFKAKFFEKSE